MKIYLLVLAFVQGISEFLPLSSSGHLVLVEKIFGISTQKLGLIVYLHLATLLAVVVYFRKDIIAAIKDKLYLFNIFVAFLFTVIVAIGVKNFWGYFLASNVYLGGAFIFTAIFLIISDRIKRYGVGNLKLYQAIIVGISQGLAIIPGISRSGLTVASAVLLGVNREAGFKFSFLLAIPTLLGAGIYEMKEITAFVNNTGFYIYFLSFLLTFITGLVAIHIFRRILIAKKLSFFGIYCCIIGLIVILSGGMR